MSLEEEINYIMLQFPKSMHDLHSLYQIPDRDPYIQHIPEFIEDSQHKFLVICDKFLKSDYSSKKQHRLGIVGRYLGDGGGNFLYKHWHRFMCIDELYREWQQPFYSFNYEKYDGSNSYCINSLNSELIQYFRDKKIDNILK